MRVFAPGERSADLLTVLSMTRGTHRSRAARDAHPLHACLPVLVEIAGQPQSDASVAALAARCASCVAVLDPVAAAGAAC